MTLFLRCVDNIVHTLTGNHVGSMPTHTCITSLVRDPEHGNYHLELVHRRGHVNSYEKSGYDKNSTDNDSPIEILLSEHHLPPVSNSHVFVFMMFNLHAIAGIANTDYCHIIYVRCDKEKS